MPLGASAQPQARNGVDAEADLIGTYGYRLMKFSGIWYYDCAQVQSILRRLHAVNHFTEHARSIGFG